MRDGVPAAEKTWQGVSYTTFSTRGIIPDFVVVCANVVPSLLNSFTTESTTQL